MIDAVVIDNKHPEQCIVIDNKHPEQCIVINDAKAMAKTELGTQPKWFREWANELREVQQVKDYRAGRGGFGGGGRWWASMPDDLRAFVLWRVAPDDLARWTGIKWDGLPDGLKMAIGVMCRETSRRLEGCPWR